MYFHTTLIFILAIPLFCIQAWPEKNSQPTHDARESLNHSNLIDGEELGEWRYHMIDKNRPKTTNIIRHEYEISQAHPQQQVSLTASMNQLKGQKTVPIQSRRLQQEENIQTSNDFIYGSSLFLKWIMVLGRNLLLIGLFTHSIEVFLPYLILSDSILMLAFWNCQKQYLTTFFTDIFDSPFDLLNALRLLLQPSTDLPNLQQLSQYGFSRWALCSVFGEMIVVLLLLILTALTKNTTLCAKYDWIRGLASKLRPKINGFIMAILPRVATLTGLHLRDFSHGPAVDSMNGITCGLLILSIGFFFILLLLQTRRTIISKSEQERGQMGLVGRIDYWREFDLDCFEWSSLYFPCMSYIRLIVYCLPIGLFWDCHEMSYGAPLVAQLFWVMAQTTSRVYLSLRQRIVFPIMSFLLIPVQLGLMMVGLAESAPYSPLSESWEVAFLVMVMVLLGVSLTFTGVDCYRQFRKRWQEGEEKRGRKNETTHRLAQSQARKTENSDFDEEKQKEDYHQQQKVQHPKSFHQGPTKKTNVKFKRAKTGKAFGGFVTGME